MLGFYCFLLINILWHIYETAQSLKLTKKYFQFKHNYLIEVVLMIARTITDNNIKILNVIANLR